MRALQMMFSFLSSETRQRVDELEITWNSSGNDPFGVSREHVGVLLTILHLFADKYFDLRVHGLEHIPLTGRAMLVGNHSGGVALDGAMVIEALFYRLTRPRLAQGMVEKFLGKIPFANLWASRAGQFTGLPEHAERLLEEERLLMVFPEGVKGTEKLYKNRFDLLDFGTGFARLAMAKNTPIIPFAFLGGADAVPTIMNAYTLGKIFGMPYLPITPWGLPIPRPTRLDLLFGAPLFLPGRADEEDEQMRSHVQLVKQKIGFLLEQGRSLRGE